MQHGKCKISLCCIILNKLYKNDRFKAQFINSKRVVNVVLFQDLNRDGFQMKS